MKLHEKSIHKYQCTECGQLMSKNHLKIHRESVHLGLIYPCQKCDHKAKTENDLKVHDKSVHHGIKYQCNECDS